MAERTIRQTGFFYPVIPTESALGGEVEGSYWFITIFNPAMALTILRGLLIFNEHSSPLRVILKERSD